MTESLKDGLDVHSSDNDPSEGTESYQNGNEDDTQTRGSAGYNDFTEDGDVVERIKSRASVTSDVRQIKALREKYKEGFFELSEDDARRPQNWPIRKRIAHTMAFGLSSFAALLGATVFAPAGYQLARQKSLGSELGVLSFCIYLIGNAIGPPLIMPLADAYGRKVCVLVPGFVSGIFHCVCANSNSMAAIVVYRFLAGVFAAGPISCSNGAIGDMWRSKVRATALVLYSTNFIIGTTISPILGALLVETGSYGWRWCSWLAGLLSLLVSTINLLFLDETYFPVVEKANAKEMRLDSGYWGLHTTQDKFSDLNAAQTILVYVRLPLVMMANPNIFIAILCSAFTTGVLFLLITTAGQQFVANHAFSAPAAQCTLVGILIGFLFGCSANAAASHRYAKMSAELGHNPLPEIRLPPMMFLAWTMPAGLFVYGWTMRASIHWIVPIVGLGLFGCGTAVILQGCSNYLTDGYGQRALSAHAANTICRSMLAGVFPLFARQLYTTLHASWASSLLGFIGIALLPIPWYLFFFGVRFRQHDPFAKQVDV